MKKNSLNPEEWLEYAKADLESAKILYGDAITKPQAKQALTIAENIFNKMTEI